MKFEKSSHYYQMFGKNMTRLLREKNLTQVEVAKTLGVCQVQVSRWCRGVNAPSMGSLFKICDTYKFKPSEFYKEDEGGLFDIIGNSISTNSSDDEVFKEYLEFSRFKKMQQQMSRAS